MRESTVQRLYCVSHERVQSRIVRNRRTVHTHALPNQRNSPQPPKPRLLILPPLQIRRHHIRHKTNPQHDSHLLRELAIVHPTRDLALERAVAPYAPHAPVDDNIHRFKRLYIKSERLGVVAGFESFVASILKRGGGLEEGPRG